MAPLALGCAVILLAPLLIFGAIFQAVFISFDENPYLWVAVIPVILLVLTIMKKQEGVNAASVKEQNTS